LIEEAFTVDTTTNPIQGEAGMTDWDAVDWSNDDDIIASVASWITPQELAAVRENAIRTARLKQSSASIRVALKFSLAEAVIDAAVKAITPPHEPQATPLTPAQIAEIDKYNALETACEAVRAL
jgi:hypothetical protein